MNPDQQAAREAFPTGLDQPEGGYRFSMDPLILAAFARPKKNTRTVDLGTGCGVAALTFLLLRAAEARHDGPESEFLVGKHVLDPTEDRILGLDIDPAMIRAAKSNAVRLGLADCFQAETQDIRQVRDHLPPGSFGMALANPPYRKPESGLPCRFEDRTRARFEADARLKDFLTAASWLLTNRGRLAVVFPTDRLAELICGCRDAKLTPKRLRLIHPRVDQPSRLALLEAVKNAGPGLRTEAPLVLYEGRGTAARLNAAALEFCPFLTKNP
jgi:tRNA1Val (adenine37-N6)-methyltransferase